MQKQRISDSALFDVHHLAPDFPLRAYLYLSEDVDTEVNKPPHFHDCLEVGYCHGGHGLFSIAEKLFSYHQGDAVVISSAEPHYQRSSEGVRSLWSWIFFDPLLLLQAQVGEGVLLTTHPLAGPGFVNLLSEESAPTLSLIGRLVAELAAPGPFHRDIVRGIVRVLMGDFHRRAPLAPHATRVRSKAISRFAPVFNHVQEHYQEPIAVGVLADTVCMSPTHFAALFRAATGTTPYQYLQSYRLAMACVQLGHSPKRIDRIAAECGFPTLSCFVRAFAKRYGTSPGRWRAGKR